MIKFDKTIIEGFNQFRRMGLNCVDASGFIVQQLLAHLDDGLATEDFRFEVFGVFHQIGGLLNYFGMLAKEGPKPPPTIVAEVRRS